jgi:hypothetical protein
MFKELLVNDVISNKKGAHARIHTYDMHVHVHTRINTHTTHTHTPTHTHLHTLKHTHTHTHTHTCVPNTHAKHTIHACARITGCASP